MQIIRKNLINILFFLLPISYLFASTNNNEVTIELSKSRLRLSIITPSIIRVTETPKKSFSDKPSLIVLPIEEKVNWSKRENYKNIKIITDSLIIEINKYNGVICFFNKNHKKILETGVIGTSNFSNEIIDGENTYRIKQKFILTNNEGIYGLGQYEDHLMNYRGHDILISQANRTDVNPFIVSTNNYGLLWDNYSVSKFHDGNDGTYFSSEVADEIDYYFVYGPTIDDEIAGYRKLTGAAPMFGKWAYGYWQSKERYQSAKELIEVVKEYRERKIPLDNIVQDWQYWGDMDQFSGMIWDSTRYPNPKAMADSIHALNAHLMVSIWPAFGNKSEIYKQMEKQNFLFKPLQWCGGKVYDAWNPAARDLYWKFVKRGLLDNGIDAYWMDGTEPEFRCTDDRYITALSIKEAGNNFLGTNARYLNTFSLETTKGVFDHQRQTTNDKRVFILTRSSFAGQQRNAAATWSGDTFASWDALKVQIASGINFSMSGIPYWTNDIGGFITDFNYPDGVKNEAYKELYVRWFQFGAFCPLFRAHGTNTPREVWQFGDKGDWAYEALVKADDLRYHLMPYIYSLAWKVTSQGYTIMRGLPMDFSDDKNTYSMGNEFMFGPSILVHPVTKAIFHPSEYNGYDITPDHFYSSDGKHHGAELRIYRGTDFNKLIYKRKFEASQVGWSGCLPTNLDTSYSLKINGKILTSSKGEYKFFVFADAGIKLWVNNKLLIDKWNNKVRNTFEGSIKLAANKKYDFKIYHEQFRKDYAMLKFNWIIPFKDIHPKEVSVYLPKKQLWYDFWTGKKYTGGENIEMETPIDIIPLFVPAGSIIPFSSKIQYAEQKSTKPLELRIYEGKDGNFTLYEDENDNYDYEKGIYSTISFKWNNTTKTLIIGKRIGSFPGMLEKRIFNIILVKKNHGIGISSTENPDKVIKYNGIEVSLSLKS